MYDIQKEYTRNTISSPRSVRTSNYATVHCIFIDFISGPKFCKMERATFGRLLLNLKAAMSLAFKASYDEVFL